VRRLIFFPGEEASGDHARCAGFGCESFQFVCGLSAPSEGAIDLAALEL